MKTGRRPVALATLLAASAPPMASLGNRIGCSSDGPHCIQPAPHVETFANSIRFAVYQPAPEAEIFTGSIPAGGQVSVDAQRFPGFAIGYSQHNWPALLRPDMSERAALARPDGFVTSSKTSGLISL